MLKTPLGPAQSGKERLSISCHFQGQQNTLGVFIQLGVLAATEEPQKPALVSSSCKDFPYDCLRTYIRAQFSLTHSFMKFSTSLPFCTPRAEVIPSPLFSFVDRLKTVCFCLLHEDLFDFFVGSSLLADSSLLGWTWQLTTRLFWICDHCRAGPFQNKIVSGSHRDPSANSSTFRPYLCCRRSEVTMQVRGCTLVIYKSEDLSH